MNYVESDYVRSGYIRLDTDTQRGITFDGAGRLIFVSAALSSVSMETVYSAWIDWLPGGSEDFNEKWPRAMRFSGKDPIPSGFTGATYFLTNNWRLVFSPKDTAVSGVLFSEDFDTAFYDYNLDPVYPITVSAVVNQVTTTQNVVSGDPASIATAVLAEILASVVPANVKLMNDAPVIGDGSEGNKWRGASV